ncbi:relaxase/mobilization nuclease family protein (plasmid) [Leptolyngbya boryana NIES-2135]|jgi:RNA polymerase-binding transcription factor DksA|uniref:Relaxase/mobilization nuclease family protein n=1 Tax=Leptolyngbya boryana NIES-2135 TaxID=1973484 RepID=A0A1Z4JR77_LEPBY|nr:MULTISPECIES: relaxase/mobilization nuclease domain-containing protein [Leptolyngbya]BAY59226.1 relaxase/mobilization nuclease family protein [Leptolyngbya boryana NIES-2135]MBD2372815.1 relaxase/mobilization nuclease domain-containing protein [Leptolyngbya sp. FACHB-238]MBD2397433.1 relaxase/mobilization nuclease domain-containing protein [Leptolyngbya sp. FACHB-239]MBD2403762.1 relaxase/mobilization nuclease domain-containing protein [Leptolyngbya sp. FACHB-402]ULP33418.1 relaxase/mobiliz
MKINYAKGNDPMGLMLYLHEPAKQITPEANPVLATNMSGRDCEERAEEFRFSHDLNPRVKKTMVHFAVSLPPGETVSHDQIAQISRSLLQKTGHQDCQYLVVRHHDREHRNHVQHWHIATSAVSLKAGWVRDSFVKLKLLQIERQLEEEFRLSNHPIRPKAQRQNLSTGEYRLKERTGKPIPKEKLWDIIDRVSADPPSMTEFVARLKEEEVEVRFRQAQGMIQGISYEIDGVAFAGCKLGPAYSFGGLQAHRQIEYDPAQDQLLLLMQKMTREKCQQWLRDQEQRKKYQALYRQYWQTVLRQSETNLAEIEAERRDVIVAARSLSDIHQDETSLMIFYGDKAQKVEQQQGRRSAIVYVNQVIQQAIVFAELLMRDGTNYLKTLGNVKRSDQEHY